MTEMGFSRRLIGKVPFSVNSFGSSFSTVTRESLAKVKYNHSFVNVS